VVSLSCNPLKVQVTGFEKPATAVLDADMEDPIEFPELLVPKKMLKGKVAALVALVALLKSKIQVLRLTVIPVPFPLGGVGSLIKLCP
jgi:hypothetical protein